eukprot:2507722-Rhodomonas_salina.1
MDSGGLLAKPMRLPHFCEPPRATTAPIASAGDRIRQSLMRVPSPREIGPRHSGPAKMESSATECDAPRPNLSRVST